MLNLQSQQFNSKLCKIINIKSIYLKISMLLYADIILCCIVKEKQFNQYIVYRINFGFLNLGILDTYMWQSIFTNEYI